MDSSVKYHIEVEKDTLDSLYRYRDEYNFETVEEAIKQSLPEWASQPIEEVELSSWEYEVLTDVVSRWDVSLEEAESFLTSIEYFEYAVKRNEDEFNGDS